MSGRAGLPALSERFADYSGLGTPIGKQCGVTEDVSSANMKYATFSRCFAEPSRQDDINAGLGGAVP